jgi:hypothetical protein
LLLQLTRGALLNGNALVERHVALQSHHHCRQNETQQTQCGCEGRETAAICIRHADATPTPKVARRINERSLVAKRVIRDPSHAVTSLHVILASPVAHVTFPFVSTLSLSSLLSVLCALTLSSPDVPS